MQSSKKDAMIQSPRWTASLALLLLSAGTLAAVPTLEPKPQAYNNTCQSYSLAYALSATGLPDFSIATIGELRKHELAIRPVIDQVAKASGYGTASHEVWREAISQYTGGRLELKLEYVRDPVAFLDRVRQLTNSWDARQSLAASYFGIAKPVMTSVTRVGRTSYSTGHIVSILGVDSRPVSPTALAVLNSAIKDGSTTSNSCRIDDLDGDHRYSAEAAVITDYDLKQFQRGHVVMYLVRKGG